MKVNRNLQNLLVTGGAGFIGTNFIRYLFDQPGFRGRVVNLDKLTYAANPANLADIAAEYPDRYHLEQADICDAEAVRSIFERCEINGVVHFAAESHVDRSIFGPREFVDTNVLGTFTLLEAARVAWKERRDVLFHHVSTDEVYGSLGTEGRFVESTPYAPRSPYSASKAASDHLVRAYYHTYGLPITLSNCSNNYGPYQFPEKLVPLMILNMSEGKSLPVYGDGKNVRDWLYVEDHASAIWRIMSASEAGETWNVGGDSQWENLRLVEVLCEKVAAAKGKDRDHYKSLVTFVKDRPGHDRRYAIDCSKIKRELGWRQTVDLEQGLERTIRWYMDNTAWIDQVRSGSYREWIDLNYLRR
jgi:dTDP-glucose 4,6-dehydratase